MIDKEIFTPFLEWVDEQDNHDISSAEMDFIISYTENVSNDLTGIWGYLLSFFDSEGIYINKASQDVIDIQYDFVSINEVSKVNVTRLELQIKAVLRGFEILKNRI